MEEKKQHWKQPENAIWYAFFADGKLLGLLQKSPQTEKEIQRLKNSCGIRIQQATPMHYIKYGVAYQLPKAITNKMERLYKKARRLERKNDIDKRQSRKSI